MEETEADLNSQESEWTLLMRAVDENHVEVVRMLLAAKVDVNVQGIEGLTALHVATVREHVDCVALLIDAQADLELRNQHTYTPLCYSMRWSDFATTALLLEAKANVWAENHDGNTPMSYALSTLMDNKKIMNMFLEQSPNEYGITALMLAASYGYDGVIPTLLEMGEDPELKDKYGMTALMLAMLPREGEMDWQVNAKKFIINMLRGDRTIAELNEMRRGVGEHKLCNNPTYLFFPNISS